MWCHFFHSQHSWIQKQEVEMGVAPLLITSNDLRVKLLLLVHMIFIPYWSRSLNSKGRNASTRRHRNVSTELKLELPPKHLEILMPLNQK